MSTSHTWILVCGSIAMVLVAFFMGANDVANAFGTSVGSKALTLGTACIIASVFESIGAIALGATVTETFRKNVINFSELSGLESAVMFGMVCALIGAMLWIMMATFFGLPVSTTHSVIGGIIGFGAVINYQKVINWMSVMRIVISWISSPTLAAIFGGLFFVLLRHIILYSDHAVQRTQRCSILLIFLVNLTFFSFLIYKTPVTLRSECHIKNATGVSVLSPCRLSGLSKIYPGYAFLISLGIAIIITPLVSIPFHYYGKYILEKYDAKQSSKVCQLEEKQDALESTSLNDSGHHEDLHVDSQVKISSENQNGSQKKSTILQFVRSKWSKMPWFTNIQEIEEPIVSSMDNNAEVFDERVESLFMALQVISACFGSLSHGANDISNAVGPYSVILSIYQSSTLSESVTVPFWVLVIGAIFLCAGLATLGHRVIKTMGVRLVKVTPSRGFCIEMASAWVVLCFSFVGVPLSTTHCQVGAAFGVGFVESWGRSDVSKFSGVNLRLFSEIFFSWILTLICSGVVSAGLFAFAVYSPSLQ